MKIQQLKLFILSLNTVAIYGGVIADLLGGKKLRDIFIYILILNFPILIILLSLQVLQ